MSVKYCQFQSSTFGQNYNAPCSAVSLRWLSILLFCIIKIGLLFWKSSCCVVHQWAKSIVHCRLLRVSVLCLAVSLVVTQLGVLVAERSQLSVLALPAGDGVTRWNNRACRAIRLPAHVPPCHGNRRLRLGATYDDAAADAADGDRHAMATTNHHAEWIVSATMNCPSCQTRVTRRRRPRLSLVANYYL